MNTTRPLPMLAKPYDPSKHDALLRSGKLVVEEKFDGHRCVVRTMSMDGEQPSVSAWSRTGIDCSHKLASHLRNALRSLPHGVYDCELIYPGGHSSDVTRLELQHKLVLVVFDLLELTDSGGATVDITKLPWSTRRSLLDGMPWLAGNNPFLFRSKVHHVKTPQELEALVGNIWEAKGEGVIVKNVNARYEPGKRRDAFLKIKDCGSTVITIVGYEAGTTTDANVMVGVDSHGTEVRVKVLDDSWRAKVAADPESFVGRALRIEYHEMTTDGKYRHARWDRWEDE